MRYSNLIYILHRQHDNKTMIYKQLTLKYQKLMLAQWSVVGVEWIKTLFVSLHLTNCNRTCPTTDATIDNTHQNYVHVIYRVPSDLQGIPVIILDEKICSVYFQQNLNFLIAILQGENEKYFAAIPLHCRIVFFLEKLKYQCYTFQALFQGYYFWI